MFNILRKKIIASCVFSVLVLSFVLTPAYALELNSSYIRLDRAAAGQNPGRILVVATTSETVSEDGVQITVGPAWSVSANSSNFTTSVTNLPAGVSAWPGVGTATNVSGQVVTFPSADILAGTQYGFYITGGIFTNPSAGAGENYLWNSATLVAASVSSSSESMVPVIANDQVVISGEVPALSYYFTADIASLTASSTFDQNEVLEYQITYGSDLLQSTPLTLQAEWSQGTISGQGSPSIDILSYVTGSASDAYGATAPIIDTVNRTITWTIPNFPATTTGQTVTFSLQTSQSYAHELPITFSVSGRVLSPAVTSDTTVSQSFMHAPDPTPSPTPSPTVGATKKSCNTSCSENSECRTGYCYNVTGRCRNEQNPKNTACLTTEEEANQTVVVPVVSPVFSSIEVKKLSNTAATLFVTTDTSTRVRVLYGKTVSSLQNMVEDTTFSQSHLFNLSDLDPSRHYYFRVSATSEDGAEATSDIFTFKTADIGNIPQLDISTVTMLSKNLSVLSTVGQKVHQVASLPTSFPYEVFFSFQEDQLIEHVYYVVVNSQILGAEGNDTYTSPVVSKTKLFETTAGVYSGQVEFPQVPGYYDSYLQVFDRLGNILEFPVSHLYVSAPLTIVNANDQLPVERARIHIYRFNEKNNRYELMNPQTFLSSNPLFTDHEGRVRVVLPHEKYRIVVDASGYETQTVEFVLGPDASQQFPRVYLHPAPQTLVSLISYHATTLEDMYRSLTTQLDLYATSNTFYALIEIFSLLLFGFLSIFALSARTHISPKKLVRYLKVHVLFILHPFTKNKLLIHGKVIDEQTKQPVSRAQVVFFEKNGQKALYQTESNRKGLFHAHLVARDVRYLVTAKEYVTNEEYLEYIGEKLITSTVFLTKSESVPKKIRHKILQVARNVLGVFFELSIFSSLLFQVLFISNLGFYRVVPFLVLSTFNVLVWLVYITSPRLLGK